MKNGKYVIAYLIHELGDYYCKEIELGALQRAEEEDVNLVFLPGKFMDRPQSAETRYEFQYNTLYDLVIEDNVDAVVIAADCIGNYSSRDRIEEFVHKYDEIPCVLVASKQPGKSCICYDNFKGIEAGVEYLLDVKECTKFAMLGGPLSNTDCVERREALVQTLARRRITFTDKNYIEGDLTRHCHEQCRELLDNNPDVEAIFCVNDECAVALYEVLEERGLTPGRDIYVLGYDNSRVAGQMRPSLSSIWADPMELSRQAFDMALNLIRGRKTPSRSLDTMLVRRDSFGPEAEHFDLEDMDTDRIKALYNKVFYRLQGARGTEYKAYKKVIRDCMSLMAAREKDISLHEQLKADFQEGLDTGILMYADMETLMDVMDEIYARISAGEERRQDRKEVRQAYGDVFKMLIAKQQESIREIVETNQSMDFSIKMVARDIMQFENGYDQNYSIPLKNLTYMGIRNAYLYMLEKPVVHLDGETMEMPEYFFLKAVMKDGEVRNITAPNQKTSIYDLYCNSYMGEDRYSMTMLPLYSTDEIYGYILCDVSSQVLDNGEILVNQLSAAYRMLHVLSRAQEIMDQLEQTNDVLKRNNIILDNLSRIDQMTGIYNRRGFYEAAEEFLKGELPEGDHYLVLYVDMDNLKIVNDRYGHDDGDFALIRIATTLKEALRDAAGVIGRIGGDEFACIVRGSDEPENIKSMMRNSFDEFNRSSDKPYNVNASVGIFRIEDPAMTLEEALALADEDLYREKQKRSKKTAKD
ncbi:MAG: GGDEF domain-containing protein [Lachnospiraceae bacterium]|nr:GGDEF domain-containing protein [Lachnospiraceae bacterium]